jgi:hypothetical protein
MYWGCQDLANLRKIATTFLIVLVVSHVHLSVNLKIRPSIAMAEVWCGIVDQVYLSLTTGVSND